MMCLDITYYDEELPDAISLIWAVVSGVMLNALGILVLETTSRPALPKILTSGDQQLPRALARRGSQIRVHV